MHLSCLEAGLNAEVVIQRVAVRYAAPAPGPVMARSHRPDLILMYIQLPGMDGLEATRLIRSDESISDFPVIAVTSHAIEGDREAAMEAGEAAAVGTLMQL